MKSATRLRLSLMANCVLLSLVLWLAGRSSSPPATAPDSSHHHHIHRHADVSAVARRPFPPARVTAPPDRSAINAPPGPGWAQALRMAGVSEKLIADFAAAEFESRWQQRWEEMDHQVERGELDRRAFQAWVAVRDEERERELRAALGDEGFARWDRERLLRGFDLEAMHLSAADAEALHRLRREQADGLRALELAFHRGEVDELGFQEQSSARRAEHERRLHELVGEHAHAGHDHGEGHVTGLRRDLQAINASAAQQDALLAAQARWEADRRELQNLRGGEQAGGDGFARELQALDAARERDFARILGADALAHLLKLQDGRYQAMQQFAPAWNLSEAEIEAVYQTLRHREASLRDYWQRVQATEAQGTPVDWTAAQANARTFARQSEESLRAYLGDERFDRLAKHAVLPAAEAPAPAPFRAAR
jgi:hypothetical protein